MKLYFLMKMSQWTEQTQVQTQLWKQEFTSLFTIFTKVQNIYKVWDGMEGPRLRGMRERESTHLLQQSHVHTSSAHTHSSSATHTFASYAPAHTAALRDLGTRFTNWSWSVFYIQKRVLIQATNTQRPKIRLRWGCTNSGCSTALLWDAHGLK